MLWQLSDKALTIRGRQILGGEEDDGHRAKFLPLLQRSEELEAIHPRHD